VLLLVLPPWSDAGVPAIPETVVELLDVDLIVSEPFDGLPDESDGLPDESGGNDGSDPEPEDPEPEDPEPGDAEPVDDVQPLPCCVSLSNLLTDAFVTSPITGMNPAAQNAPAAMSVESGPRIGTACIRSPITANPAPASETSGLVDAAGGGVCAAPALLATTLVAGSASALAIATAIIGPSIMCNPQALW